LRRTTKNGSKDTSKPPTKKEGKLFDALKGISDNQLRDAVGSAEGFTAEREENSKRGVRAELRHVKAKIKRWFYWFLFWLICTLIAAFCIGTVIVVCHWVAGYWDDSKRIENLIFNTMWSLLVIFATLFFEGVFKHKDD
jgi:hypothetical protein